ncbi:sugar ABC transporter ATP-binding protein [Arthrobacter globiformis]|uniref:sugar ABC transporter ATP-binding protein n=1 Tax=Arthrobacter globiformis TaxID=1665 RepID=UPI002780C37E|nr:sugar ABC transporter ATP-binding protein [Arthrobacter globiformis]MDQ0867306.1 ribose transport system ATP-binding protein [Arthrobacter globiformis]
MEASVSHIQLALSGISKTFNGQKALDDVSFSIPKGSITALLGMNGSGKSTIIKILAGIYAPDPGGTLEVAEETVELPLTPHISHQRGFRFLHQDLGLIPELSIADNFAFADSFRRWNGTPLISSQLQNEHVSQALAFFDIHEHPETLVGALDPSTRTMVGIARLLQDEGALSPEVLSRHILVLDEPTASLPAEEVERVLSVLERVRDLGGTVVYVSHRTDEVRRIADRVVVLRDGKVVAEQSLGSLDSAGIVSLILGKALEEVLTEDHEPARGPALMALSGIRASRLRDISFTIHAGEVLGIAGLAGCGRSELTRVLTGAQTHTSGEMVLQGKPYDPKTPQYAVQRGVASVPQNRRADGCIVDMTVRENVTLGRLGSFVNRAQLLEPQRELAESVRQIEEFSVKPADPEATMANLSGGNQQKVVVARASSQAKHLMVLDEPTQGVDALAKQEICTSLRAMASTGIAVAVGSSDFQELAAVCDRVLILDRGHLVAEVEGQYLTEANLTTLSSRGNTSGKQF